MQALVLWYHRCLTCVIVQTITVLTSVLLSPKYISFLTICLQTRTFTKVLKSCNCECYYLYFWTHFWLTWLTWQNLTKSNICMLVLCSIRWSRLARLSYRMWFYQILLGLRVFSSLYLPHWLETHVAGPECSSLQLQAACSKAIFGWNPLGPAAGCLLAMDCRAVNALKRNIKQCVSHNLHLCFDHTPGSVAAETICHLKLYKFSVWQLAFIICLTEVMERSKDAGVDTK